MTEIERLNEVLKEVFLSLKIYRKADMADFLGYNSPYFSGIINGKEKLTESFLDKISDKLNINSEWIKTGEGDKFLSSINIQGDNHISNSGIMGNTHIGSGNSINVSLPEKGHQKIIKPDGTIEIVSINSGTNEGIASEDSSVVKNLQDQIQYLQDQIKSYKDIIEEQKGIIQLLKENRKS